MSARPFTTEESDSPNGSGRAPGQDLTVVAAVLALVGSALGFAGEFLPMVTIGNRPFSMLGTGFLTQLGNGVSILQADVFTALAAVCVLAFPRYRRISSVVLTVLGAKYVVAVSGYFIWLLGNRSYSPGGGAFLGLASGLLVLWGGLLAMREAWRKQDPLSN